MALQGSSPYLQGTGISLFQTPKNVLTLQPTSPKGIDMNMSGGRVVPWYTANRPKGNTGEPTPDGSGNTGFASSTPSVNQDTVNQLTQSVDLVQSALDRLAPQLSIARNNIGKSFEQQNNELISGKAAAQNQYNTSTNQNAQNRRTNYNVINDQASNGLRGLLRSLGAFGAVGSDLGVAGNAVTNEANLQRSGANQTFAQNQQNLDTNWGTYLNDFGNEQRKLNDWKTQQLNDAEAQSLSTKQDLLSRLADYNGKLSAARGGSYTDSAQPFLDQATSLGAKIDALGKLNPTYTGKTPVYTAAALDSYNANPASINFQQAQSPSGIPLLSLLLSRDKVKQAQ